MAASCNTSFAFFCADSLAEYFVMLELHEHRPIWSSSFAQKVSMQASYLALHEEIAVVAAVAAVAAARATTVLADFALTETGRAATVRETGTEAA
jgi:hypothetical protein